MVLALILVLAGLAALVVGAGLLVDGSATVAQRMQVPPIAIGLTIVAFGTSAPELVVSVFASVTGASGVLLGNLVGSNIFNVLLILGVAALVRPLTVSTQTTWIEIPLSLLAAVLVSALALDQFLDGAAENVIYRAEGIALLGFFVIFLVYSGGLMREGSTDAVPPLRDWSTRLCVVAAIGGVALLVAGGRAVVYGASEMASGFGMSDRLIALTVVSAGTSLPELVTSVVAAARDRVDLAVGNVVGSNIFNLFGILGIATVLRAAPVPVGSEADLAVNVGAGVLLFLFAYFGKGKRISRPEGAGFLGLYLVYITILIISA
jgi:cation:H+ antiporter